MVWGEAPAGVCGRSPSNIPPAKPGYTAYPSCQGSCRSLKPRNPPCISGQVEPWGTDEVRTHALLSCRRSNGAGSSHPDNKIPKVNTLQNNDRAVMSIQCTSMRFRKLTRGRLRKGKIVLSQETYLGPSFRMLKNGKIFLHLQS